MAKTDRFASQIAHRIENGIIAAGWPVGEVLGSEAELIEQYGVSRGVLREAVRLLEHKQVATMRPGRNGGLIVDAPAPAAVAETISNYFALSEITSDEVIVARRHIETDCLRLASDRLSERGIGRLRAIAELGDPDRFHHALAEHSRNPALSIVVHGLVRSSACPVFDTRSAERTVTRHRALVENLLCGDLVGAQQLLHDDLDHVRDTIALRGTRIRRPDQERRKLPEQLATRIVRDLRRGEWQPGDVIGSEHELVERYEVSRAVFRQAVRILDYYDMLGMKQGAGGGVVVGARDATHVVDAAVTYLEFIAIEPTALSEARRVLELAALTELMAQDDIDLGRLRGEYEDSRDVDRTIVYKRGPDFHLTLTELSRNRPIHFFAMVLARLQTSRIGGRKRTTNESSAIGARIVDAHGGLIDAIADGDLALARHRLDRHLAWMVENIAKRRVIQDVESEVHGGTSRPVELGGGR